MAETQARRKRGVGENATAFIRDAPFEVLKELLDRLSPKWILRMRSVCKAWRDRLCSRALLAALHSEEPPRPLLCFDGAACPDHYLRLRDYRVESLDLGFGSDKLRSVFRFPDREFLDLNDNDLWARDAPPIDASRVDYERMEKNDVNHLRQQLLVHGSLDGYLLVSFAFCCYVINPATRHWVWLPYLDNLGDLQPVGFYEHVPSGDYRVLCVTGKRIGEEEEESTCWYHVLHVSPVQLRFIGRPISPAAPEDQDQVLRSRLAYGVQIPCISPPIQLKRNHHLHWPPQLIQQNHMLVFDTEEEFSWKKPPPEIEDEMSLLEFPNGDLGLSLSRMNKPTMELWRLQDYQNDVWVLVYRIQLVLQQMPRLLHPLDFFWVPTVVSHEGDVLIQCRPIHGYTGNQTHTDWVLHCDRNGNLLRQFWFPESATPLVIGHVLRESLLLHPMFRAPKVDGAPEPPFFRGLCVNNTTATASDETARPQDARPRRGTRTRRSNSSVQGPDWV